MVFAKMQGSMQPEHLQNLAFFSGLDSVDLKFLAPFFTPVSFPAGEVVFRQGDHSDYLYLVITGEVVIRYKPDDGPVMDVTHVRNGGVFGWSAAMNNPAYTSGAFCLQETETVRIRGTDLRGLCEQYPSMGKVILARLADIVVERKRSTRPDLSNMLETNLCQQLPAKGDEQMTGTDLKSEIQMKALVEQLSAYIETYHGGSAEYISFDGKVLKVRLGGACLGCPLSPSTLHGWVEGTVRQFFPDIECVESV